jgi:hypothetical protein
MRVDDAGGRRTGVFAKLAKLTTEELQVSLGLAHVDTDEEARRRKERRSKNVF